MVSWSAHIYNHARPHQSLRYKTPDEVHRVSLAATAQPELQRC